MWQAYQTRGIHFLDKVSLASFPPASSLYHARCVSYIFKHSVDILHQLQVLIPVSGELGRHLEFAAASGKGILADNMKRHLHRNDWK